MTKHKVYSNFDGNVEHEYDITVNEKDNGKVVYKLIRSRDGRWSDTHKGITVLKIVNTGNGYKFPGGISKHLEYDETAELYILLRFINDYEDGGMFPGNIETTVTIKNTEL